jgi:mannose-6-phosphate isomerase-like protein (cupin superfamily)
VNLSMHTTDAARSLAILGLLSVALPLMAQTIVPVEQEPVHTIVFENDVVRVIDAALPVGHATLNHTHIRDNVPVAVAGGRVSTTAIGREPVESAVKVGQVSFAVGGYTHVVRNIGPTPLHFIDVELRTSAPAAATPAPVAAGAPIAGHALELSNTRVRVHRVIVAPGRRLEAHRHAGPVLDVLVAGDAVQHGAGDISPVAAGSFRWHGDGAIDAVRNTGRVPYAVVEVEWIK